MRFLHTFITTALALTISQQVFAQHAPVIRPPYVVGVHPSTPLIWTPAVTGDRPLKFSAKSLPTGLTINQSIGTITGLVSKPGNYTITVDAKNSSGNASKTVHIIVGNALALTPPMGWNSYDAYGDTVTEAEVLENANYVRRYMQPYGWDTVVVDFRWYDPHSMAMPNQPWKRAGVFLTMDPYGRLTPSPNRFPSAIDGTGFKHIADEIHAMGLKFGIHIMRGIPKNAVAANLPIYGTSYHASDAASTDGLCRWCYDMDTVKGDTPAGQAYYNSIFKLYASWGVDFVKMDDTSVPYHKDEIEAVDNAIAKCGRSIEYSLSPGETPIVDADHVIDHANMWRLSGDFWDSWSALNHSFDLDTKWQNYRGPGHWPDSDMLPVGHLSVQSRSVDQDRHTRFTPDEQITMLSLWCLQPAPLMVGANLPDNDAFTHALLTNPDVLALDQDSNAVTASRVSVNGKSEVWARKLADGSLAVGLFNRDDSPASITASFGDLGISGPYSVRDLWKHQVLGTSSHSLIETVAPHGAVLLRLTKSN